MNPRLKTVLLLAITIAVWSSTWLAIRLGLEGVPPLTGAALRMLCSGVILVAVALALRVRWPRERIYPLHVAVQGSLLFCFQYALLYWAEQFIPSGLAAVLFATVPIITASLAAYVFKLERFSATNVAGLLLGFAGVGVIYWSEVVQSRYVPAAGVAACLIAPVGAAFALVFAKRYAHGISPLATVGPGQLVGGTILGVLAVTLEHGRPVHFNAASLGALAYLTVFGSAIVFLAYFTLMRTISVTRLSLLTYVTPVIAVALGALVAGERFAPAMFVGAAVILIGIWLVNIQQPAIPQPAVQAGAPD